jgi:hypothetical protein
MLVISNSLKGRAHLDDELAGKKGDLGLKVHLM